MYFSECFDHLTLYSFSDATEDLALVHFMYWGRLLPGISVETARKVLEITLKFEVHLHDLSGSRFQLFHDGREKLKVVPHVSTCEGLLCEYHKTLCHIAGQGLFEAIHHDYW